MFGGFLDPSIDLTNKGSDSSKSLFDTFAEGNYGEVLEVGK